MGDDRVRRAAPQSAQNEVAPATDSSGPVRPGSTRLQVGSVDDPLERQADVIADEMVTALRRTPSVDAGGLFPATSERIQDGPRPPVVSRSTTDRVQRSALGVLNDPLAGGPLDDATSGRIQAARTGGAPLPETLRSPMEQTVGRSLENVRIHTGSEASSLNEALSARAFTTGNDVFFGAGEFRPASSDGQRLIAHEVAHTVQQDSTVGRVVRREPGDEPDMALMIDLIKFEVEVSVFGAHTNVLSGVLSQFCSMAAAALGNPGLLGAVEGMKGMALGLLNVVSASAGQLASAWSKIEGAGAKHPAAAAMEPFIDAVKHLPQQLKVWELLIIAAGPGGPAPAFVVQGELLFANGMITGMSPMAVRFARQGESSAPSSPPQVGGSQVSAPQVGGSQVSAPQVGGSQVSAPHVGGSQVSAPAPAPVKPPPGPSGGLVAEALAEPKPNKAPKRYPFTKAIQPHYVLESTEGSEHLPDIFQAGEDAVLAGKFTDVGAFMIKCFGWEQADVDKYVTRKEKSVVSYLDPAETKTYELHDGAPMTQGPDGQHVTFDTANMFSKHSGNGFAVYVMDPSGKMYANQHKVGLFHHSSFLAGGDVAGAGEIKVENGAVKWVTNKTGHYRAGERELWQVLDELKSRGVNLSGVDVSTFSEKRGTARPGKAAKAYQDFKPGA